MNLKNEIAPSDRSFGLDVMRALAITLVVVAHVFASFYLHKVPNVFTWFAALLGVDIFFSLSGFLIGGILIKLVTSSEGITPARLLRFLVRRWLRTLPLYYTMLLLNLLLAVFIFSNAEGFSWKYLFFLQNFLASESGFFGESWSLVIEEWFYLLFPLGLLFFFAARRIPMQSMLVYTILFVIATIVGRFVFVERAALAYIVPVLRLDAIAYGVIAAICFKLFPCMANSKKLVLLCICLLCLCVPLYLKSRYLLQISHVYFTCVGLGFSLLLPWCYSNFSVVNPLLRKLITFISKISYSIYLVNLPVVHLLEKYGKGQNGLLMTLLALLLIVGGSASTYYLIEQPFMRWRNRKFPL